MPLDRPDGAAAQVSYRHGHLRFIDERDPSAGYIFEVTQAIEVLAPAGRSATELVLVLSEWEELEMLWGRVRLEDGDVFDVKPGSIATETLTDSLMMSTGARRVRVHPNRIRVGAIFEVGYRIRSSRPFDLPHWDLDGPYPIRETRLRIEVPEGFELGYGVVSGGEPVPFDAAREDGALVFEQKNVRPIRADVFGPLVADQQTRLRLFVRSAPNPEGAFPDWAAVSDWYRSRVSSLEPLPDEILTRVQADLRQRPDSATDAALYDLVRRHIRYVALFSGIGAYVPHSAESTWRSGYGDCKDMATLLVSLLRAFEYEAHPVMVSTLRHPTVDPAVPALSAFDHVIVASRRAPGDPWRYSDPTDPIAEFGELALQTAGRPALMVRENARLSTTPSGTLDDHEVLIRVVVDPEGPVELEARLSGQPSRSWRAAARRLGLPGSGRSPRAAEPPDQAALRVLIGKQLLPLVSPHEIDSARIEIAGREVVLKAVIDRAAAIRTDDTGSRLRLSKIWHPVELLPEARDRELRLGPPFRLREEVVFRGLDVSASDALAGRWRGPGVRVRTDIRPRDDDTVLLRHLERTRDTFAAEELETLREWSARAARAARSWIVLESRS